MREILFRGKRKDNGEWVEGIPIVNHIGTFICFDENPHYCSQYGYMEIDDILNVDPETVGQYTGHTDKNGKRIFDGDIVKALLYNEMPMAFPVTFRVGCFWYGNWNFCEFLTKFRNIEVIGNIHDNPELLEVEEQWLRE